VKVDLAFAYMTDIPAIPHIDGLFDLACRNGVDIRPTLLRVVTDLYVQKYSHTAEEEAQFIALAKGLIDNVDPVTRATVAARLAAYPKAPAEILDRLGATFAPQMAEPEATFSPAEPAGENLADLFFAADSYERRLILLNIDPVPQAAQTFASAPESCRRLEAAAMSHNTQEFCRLLQSALSIPDALAQRIVQDAGGEPLVVALRALGMPMDALQRVLLFLDPAIGESVARVYELTELYREITITAAERMLVIWRGDRSEPRRGAHQPALYDDEARSARSAATPSRYRTARRSDALAARFKSTGR
jgi:uncharacterized protein (DUF2336 family)